eukprot:NODE_24287_length_631_cov_2.053571.p1 GENE.NODE_24287_length_631_cov_2.053571~~NODE_24287_length_631_cov_2.053571.p1  ORF type:complete len:86 (-),score=23.86 NODE_24287_length_631_cov_2.053571:175-432(-)
MVPNIPDVPMMIPTNALYGNRAKHQAVDLADWRFGRVAFELAAHVNLQLVYCLSAQEDFKRCAWWGVPSFRAAEADVDGDSTNGE